MTDGPTDEALTMSMQGDPPGERTASTVLEPVGEERIAKTVAPSLETATRVHRFVVLEKLGEGGMGQVYAAYDTLLDRKVAMKVVRPGRVPSGIDARTRLLREAQAMARLRHPNVVTVLEVGELDDGVFLALELVEGETMKTWLRAQRRPWREVTEAFVAAGRGLAAAHAVGLVHRDVKPDNILRGSDGQILITDFGVASMSSSSTPSPGGSDDTWSGFRVGTPAYMSPEQFAGEPADPRADQFSFCVALWEGVFGERPFEPSTPVDARRLRPVPERTNVPAWLVAVLQRGMATDASARWPSMDALIGALTRKRGLRRWGVQLAVAGVISIGASVAFVANRRADVPPPCSDEARPLTGIWDPAQAATLDAAFRKAGGGAVVTRVRDHLDRWTERWVEHRTTACKATRVRHDRSEAMWEATVRCLDRRLVGLRAIVRELQVVGHDDLGRAVEITANLPDLQRCEDDAQLAAMATLPSDPALRARIEALEHELARAAALERSGRYPAALAAAAPVVDQAAETRYLPVRAEAMAMVGRLRAQMGEQGEGIKLLREAARVASAGRADDVAAAALVELVWATADDGRGGEALAVAAVVRPMVERVMDPVLDALLTARVGEAKVIAGDLDGAVEDLQHALELVQTALGRTHYQAAQVLNRLGVVEERRNHPQQAREHYRAALAIVEEALGREHPATAVTRANLCFLDSSNGRLDEAATCYGQVIQTLEVALGPSHPQVAWALNDAGLVALSRGRVDEARASWERAVTIYESVGGGRHADLAWPLVNLATLALNANDSVRAETLCKRALALVEDGSTFEPLVCVGAAIAERRPAEAIDMLDRALQMEEAGRAPDARGTAQFALARARFARGDRPGASTAAHAALAAFTEAKVDADRATLLAWAKQRNIKLP